MKTTQKAFNKLNPFFINVRYLIDYIEQHEDGKKVRESIVFEKFKRNAMRLNLDLYENNLI